MSLGRSLRLVRANPMTTPMIVASAKAKKPSENPKADLRRYYMLAHGCHLLDTARYLAGEIAVLTRYAAITLQSQR